jgi:hypothetical protein
MVLDDETYDYGLDPGESFDPNDDIKVNRSDPHAMTVLGPIHPGALGPVNLAASFVPRDPGADIAEMVTEIQEAAVVGLNGLVDLRPIESSQEARAALWLAERCDIHLIIATGIHPELGLAGNVARAIDHASNGMFGTLVCPGLIVASPEPEAIRIGRSASEATGLPLVIDCRNTQVLPDLEDARVRIAVSSTQVTERIDNLLIDLAADQDPGSMAGQLLSNVHNPQPLVGYDPGGKGSALFSRWNWLIEEFPIELLEAGFDPWQARALMIDAPAEFLTITLPLPPRC